MKIMIYLASHDPDASSNFERLFPARASDIRDVTRCQLQVDNNKLVPVHLGKNLFTDVTLSEKNEVTVELIAHGNPNSRNEILSMQKGAYRPRQSNTFAVITPKILEDYFKTVAFENGQYKFNNLTLFCCSSLEFGKALSQLMKGVNIKCFNEDIRIDIQGEARNGYDQNKKAIPYVFLEGKLLENISENKHPDQPQSPLEQDRESKSDLVNSPAPLLRGNPYDRFDNLHRDEVTFQVTKHAINQVSDAHADSNQQTEIDRQDDNNSNSPSRPHRP